MENKPNKSHKLIQQLYNYKNPLWKDGLTGLYNVSALNKIRDSLTLEMIKGSIINKYNIDNNIENTFSILYCDINFLKYLNDTSGHDKADVDIVKISNIIKECIRTDRKKSDVTLVKNNSIAFRVGGDEFLVLLTHCTKKDAEIVKNRIKDKIQNMNGIFLSLAIGIADTNEVEPPKNIYDDNIKDFFIRLKELAENRMKEDKKEIYKNLAETDKNKIIVINTFRSMEMLGLDIFNEEDFEDYISLVNNSRDNHIKEKITKKKKK